MSEYWKYEELEYANISELVGKTLVDATVDDSTLFLTTSEGWLYRLEHEQDCCENVYIESLVGDVNDLVGEPIRVAEESTQDDPDAYECGMWTFYKFATRKGWVDVRYYGSSNGYYGVGVSCHKKKVG